MAKPAAALLLSRRRIAGPARDWLVLVTGPRLSGRGGIGMTGTAFRSGLQSVDVAITRSPALSDPEEYALRVNR